MTTPYHGTQLRLPPDVTVSSWIDGEGDGVLSLQRVVTAWQDEEIVDWAEARITFTGTPEELSGLARRIDTAVAQLLTADVVPLDGAAFHPEVVADAKHLEAIEDVVDALTMEWSVDEDRARVVVREIAASMVGPLSGYDNFAEAVAENTAYVVAEHMVEEERFTPPTILCGECGESVVPGEDEIVTGKEGEDCHARCVPGAVAEIEGW